MRDSLRELWPDAVRARDHRAVAAGERALQVADSERREDRECDRGANALDAGEQAEPVGFLGLGETEQAQEILADEQLGVDGEIAADRAQGVQRARRCPDETNAAAAR